jgi:hypothetical protein
MSSLVNIQVRIGFEGREVTTFTLFFHISQKKAFKTSVLVADTNYSLVKTIPELGYPVKPVR